jgi:hypothetical protein
MLYGSWEQARFWALSHRQLDVPSETRSVHFWRALVFLATDPIPQFRGLGFYL